MKNTMALAWCGLVAAAVVGASLTGAMTGSGVDEPTVPSADADLDDDLIVEALEATSNDTAALYRWLMNATLAEPPSLQLADFLGHLDQAVCAAGLDVLASQGIHPPTNSNTHEFDPLTGDCRAFRDALQDTFWGDGHLYLKACTPESIRACIVLGHPMCDIVLMAPDGIIYVCLGGLDPSN